MQLKGKTAIITGASSGIGKETAFALAKKGCNIIITYNRGREEGLQTTKECSKYAKADAIQLDVRENESIKKFATKIGKADILINNAGIFVQKKLSEHSEEEIENQIATNLTGLIKLTKALLPKMQREAVIINIASGAGKQGYGGMSVYCATKFAVRGFTQSLAAELPSGMRTYCVNPGVTATRMTNYKGLSPEKVAEIIVKTAEEKLGKKSGEDVDVWEYE